MKLSESNFPCLPFFSWIDLSPGWVGASWYWLGVNGEVYDWYFSRCNSPPPPSPQLALQHASPWHPLRKTPLMLIHWLLESKKHSSSRDIKCKYSHSHSQPFSCLGKDLNIVCTSWSCDMRIHHSIYLLSIYCVLGIVPGIEDTQMKRQTWSFPHVIHKSNKVCIFITYILWCLLWRKQIG